MTLTRSELEVLRDRILALSLPERLFIVAELIQRGKPTHAEMILRTVTDELTIARLQRGST